MFSTCLEVFKSNTDTARKQSQHNTGLLKTHTIIHTTTWECFVAPRIKSLLVTVDNLLMRVVPTTICCWSSSTANIIFRLRAVDSRAK